MLRPLPRALRTAAPRYVVLRNAVPHRSASSFPPASRPRSWKSSAARWGIAFAGIYFYNTSDLFRRETDAYKHLLEHQVEDDILPTIDHIAARRREERQLAMTAPSTLSSAIDLPPPPPPSPSYRSASVDATSSSLDVSPGAASADASMAIASPGDLEEEAEGEGAFNEETGEINWDCPCLGGMAHGPCGPQFREAFSCFVYSKEEPKGIDCIDRFKVMQDCFRQYPDVYGAELSDDPEDDAEYQAATREVAETASEGHILGSEPTPVESNLAASGPPSKTSKNAQSAKKVTAANDSPSTISSPSSSSLASPSATSIADTVSSTASAASQKISSAASTASDSLSSAASSATGKLSRARDALTPDDEGMVDRVKAATAQVLADHGGEDDASLRERSESEQMVPKAWHDSRDSGVSTGGK